MEIPQNVAVVLKQFGHVPMEGETFTEQGYSFEVLDMDGHRVDKVLVLTVKPAVHARELRLPLGCL